LAEPVTNLQTNGATPDRVTLAGDDVSAAFTPRELDAVKAHFGRAFSQIIADESTDEKFTVLGWLKLRRMGFDVSLDAMLDVVIELDANAVPDPTSVGRPTT
jgi:hypothetical protein